MLKLKLDEKWSKKYSIVIMRLFWNYIHIFLSELVKVCLKSVLQQQSVADKKR